MQYKVINKNKDCLNNDNLLYTLLQQRGVEDPNKLMNLDSDCVYDGMLLNNMDRGLNMLYWHLTNGCKIHVIDDSDFDGYSSAASCINYIRDIGFNNDITFSIHKNKEHGIILNRLKDYEFDLLIVPDAGSSDMEQCKELKDKDILILDHH